MDMEKKTPSAFRKVFNLLGKNKASFATALLLCSATEPIYQIGFTFGYKYIINGIEFKNASMLINSVIALIAVVVVYNIIQPISGYYYEREVYKPTISIERDLLRSVMQMPLSFFTKTHSGNILSRVTNDLGSVSQFFKEHCYDIANQIILGIGALVSLILLDIRFLPIIVAFGLMSLFINNRFKNRFYRLNQQLQIRMSKTNELINDLVVGLPIIKVFRAEKAFQKKYQHGYQDVTDTNNTLNKTSIKKNAVDTLISSMSFFTILALGVLFYHQKSLTLGDLSAILALQGSVVGFFVNLGNYINNYKSSLAGAQRIFEFLDMEKEDNTPRLRDVRRLSGDSAEGIVFDHVYFQYDKEKQTLQDVTMNFNKNTFTAIAGMSGGGKTTLLKLLLKFYPPEQGNIRLFGRDITEFGADELRSMVAYIEQTPVLLHDTIYRNICCGLDNVPMDEVINAARQAGAHEFIAELPEQYDTVIGPKGMQLSGGQMQRIAIARAIIKKAPVVIFDEPTSALDYESEATIISYIKSYSQNHIVLLVAHRMTNIIQADYIYVLEEGTVAEEGTYKQLMESKGRLYELHKAAKK